ncbi:hypothetical protein GCM10022205_25810 [Spinactinospora alkalitolerans]
MLGGRRARRPRRHSGECKRPRGAAGDATEAPTGPERPEARPSGAPSRSGAARTGAAEPAGAAGPAQWSRPETARLDAAGRGWTRLSRSVPGVAVVPPVGRERAGNGGAATRRRFLHTMAL